MTRPTPLQVKGVAVALALSLLLLGQFEATGTPEGNAKDAKAEKKDCVVLLHGMGRTKASMWMLSRHLSRAGFKTVNHGYPWRRFPIEQLAAEHIPAAIEKCKPCNPERIHFVGHSLGGILVRYYLQDHTLPEGSRVVMLSPPNQGSELADRFKDRRIYRWLTGPPGQQLGTGARDLPRSLGPARGEIGIITGKRSLEPWFSRLLPGEDDGKVTVEAARLEGMKEFLVLNSDHIFIMYRPKVMKAVTSFLKSGAFGVGP